MSDDFLCYCGHMRSEHRGPMGMMGGGLETDRNTGELLYWCSDIGVDIDEDAPPMLRRHERILGGCHDHVPAVVPSEATESGSKTVRWVSEV